MEDLTAVVDTNTMCPSNKKKKQHQYRYMSDEPPEKNATN